MKPPSHWQFPSMLALAVLAAWFRIVAPTPTPSFAELAARRAVAQNCDTMPRLRVHCFALSLDGYGAGPEQSLANPLGAGGIALHEWAFATRTFQRMLGNDGGATGIDDDFVARGFANIGAWIMGRNMFGPVRGAWPDDEWKGWWGKEPPYHTPMFVLTHHPRAAVTMAGGASLTHRMTAAAAPIR